MLFRPLYPKYLGKWRLPFTPGIIPRRKDALAKAIGRAVGEELLTKEDIQRAFLGEEKRSALIKKWADVLENFSGQDIRALSEKSFSKDVFDEKREALAKKLSLKAASALSEMKIGETVAKLAGDAVLEKIKSSPLGMFVGEGMVRSVAGTLADKVDEYIELHGQEKLFPFVDDQLTVLSETPTGKIAETVGFTRSDAESIIGKLYDEALLPAIGEASAAFDVSAEVEKKISSMDVKELEKLCLSVMKKELNAITWLGGLIGFVLGLVNIFL